MGIFIHPFLNLVEEEAFNEYNNATYTFENEEPNVPVTPCLGLAAASIYELPAISFSKFPFWENPSLTVSIDKMEIPGTKKLQILPRKKI